MTHRASHYLKVEGHHLCIHLRPVSSSLICSHRADIGTGSFVVSLACYWLTS